MKTTATRQPAGFTLIEMLTYVVVLAAVLGVGGGALNRLWSASGHIRREADDLRASLAAGELWRADVRGSAGEITSEGSGANLVLTLHLTAGGTVHWAFVEGSVVRRVGATNEWVLVLRQVRDSAIREDSRGAIRAWRWDLELEPVSKKSRFRRQLSFLAVPSRPTP